MRKFDIENVDNIDLAKIIENMSEDNVNIITDEQDNKEDDEITVADVIEDTEEKDEKEELKDKINETLENIEENQEEDTLYDNDSIKVILQDYKELKAKYDELNDKYIRTMADFGNFRKRNLEENRLKIDKSKVGILKEVILLNDTFEKAFKEADENQSFDNLYEGVKAIQKFVDILLEKENVHPIDAIGEKFNPEIHDCVAVVPMPGKEAETIIDEIEKGYMINKTVVRPSKVVVAGGSSEEPNVQNEEKEEETTLDNIEENVEDKVEETEDSVENTDDIGEEIPVNIN